MNIRVLIEAGVVGIVVVVIGTLVGFVIGYFTKTELPPVCKDWNKNHVMEASLFLTGVITHILFEMFGGNKWYCKNGNACKK
tara:strand:- start:283 stop:528 length:246 start_codon:yes stop_codon:yes gene_type:complete